MRLTYELTVDDATAMLEYNARRSPERWPNAFFAWGTVAALACAVLVVCLIKGSWGALQRLGPWVILYALATLLPVFTRRRRLRRIAEDCASKMAFGAHGLEITPEGLMMYSATGEGRAAWTCFDRVVRTPTHALVFTGPRSGLAIPRDRVTSGDFEAFVAALQAQIEAANRAAAPSAPLTPPTAPPPSAGVVARGLNPRVPAADAVARVAHDMTPTGHSGYALTAFVLALVLWVANVVVFLAGVVSLARAGGGAAGGHGPMPRVSTLTVLASCPVAVLGIFAALAGLVDQRRRKVIAVLGLVGNALFVLGVGGVFVVGSLMRP